MTEDRPAWARRMASERKVRRWSQAEAVRAMRAHAPGELSEDASLLRQWKRWESGQTMPSEFYQPIIAKTFGTVTHAMFPVPPQPDANAEIVAASGMDTLELVARLQRSDLDEATLNAVRVMADTLCSEYASRPADDLLTEGRAWLRRVTQYQGQRLTLQQHREILVQAGWMALLIGCVEYDTGDKPTAETTRQAALSLGVEADHAQIQAWAHEIRAWMNLTSGDYHGVIAAAQHAPMSRRTIRSRCSWPRRKPRHGRGSGIAARPKSHSTADGGSWTPCPTQRTWTTTSWSTRPSLTSTPWTATGCSPKTRWPKTSQTRSSAPAPTSTVPSEHPCDSPKPASPSAWSPPAKVTSKKQSTTASKLSTVSVNRFHRCSW